MNNFPLMNDRIAELWRNIVIAAIRAGDSESLAIFKADSIVVEYRKQGGR